MRNVSCNLSFVSLRVFPAFIFLLVLLASPIKLRASEGGATFYIPGLYGDLAVAIPPPPGAYLLSTSIFYQAKAPNPLFPNAIDRKVDADIFAQMLRGFYVPDASFLGAQMLFGFRVLTLDSDISVDVDTPFGSLQLDDSNTGYGDFGIVPLSLYWQVDNFYINLYEVINAPTGRYEPGRIANIALGHWTFDTVLVMTWLDPKTGIEISAVPGIIYNSENMKTNYKSGVEFHMDTMLNWHISPSWMVGLHGSIYKQLTDDEGADHSLGSFRGHSFAFGPAIAWHQDIGEQKYLLSAKWLHEFEAKNKLEGDLILLTAGIKF